ncbi:hypothetical protein D3C73_867640 [compost metagenome]
MTLFLAAAPDERSRHQHFATGNERADAFRTGDLVGGNDQEVGIQGVDVERDASGRLNRIDNHQATILVSKYCRLGHRLDDACLVIDEHHRHHRKARSRIVIG